MERHVEIHSDDGHNEIKTINIEKPFELVTGPSGNYRHDSNVYMCDVLDRYLILKQTKALGNGAFGTVYSARIEGCNTPCAVKISSTFLEYGVVKWDLASGRLVRQYPHLNPKQHDIIRKDFQDVQHEIKTWLYLELGHHMENDLVQIGKYVPSQEWVQHVREAQKVCKLEGHQFIHRLIEFNVSSIPCIVSELCNGDLLSIYNEPHNLPFLIIEGSTPSALWVKVMTSIAHGIHYMHKMGVAHRDIKPVNVLYKIDNRGYNFFITDFAGCEPAHKKRVSERAFTRFYSPPEAFDQNGAIPAICDAYAFAKTGLDLLHRRTNLDAECIFKVDSFIHRPTTRHPQIYPLVNICKTRYPNERYSIFLQWCHDNPHTVVSNIPMHHHPVPAHRMLHPRVHNTSNEHQHRLHAQPARRRQGGNGDCVCS